MSYLAELIKSIFPDPQTALFLIVLSLIAMWMYKQFRTNILESQKNLVIKTEKAIDIYSDLDVEIKKTLREHLELSLLETKISKSKAYLPYELMNEFDVWIESDDGEEKYNALKVLRSKLREEILRLKRTQNDPISYQNNNGGITEFIEIYIRTKLSSFIEPLFHTGITLFISLTAFVLITVVATTEDWTQKVLLVSILVAIILFILILDIIVTMIMMKKRFKHSKTNWILFGLFIVAFLVLLFYGPWFRGIILIALIFIYAFYASRKSIN